MGFLPSLERPCDACEGTGYRAEVRDLVVRGSSLPGLAALSLDEMLVTWADVDRIARPIRLAVSLGLGYLRFGQPARTLSGGEAQRLKLAGSSRSPPRRRRCSSSTSRLGSTRATSPRLLRC
jgi:excinuclease ABC subunit A